MKRREECKLGVTDRKIREKKERKKKKYKERKKKTGRKEFEKGSHRDEKISSALTDDQTKEVCEGGEKERGRRRNRKR